MSLPTGAPAQDSASSTLAIPPSDLQIPRTLDTPSSSSELSSHESGPSTPASSIQSSTASSIFLQAPKVVPPATNPHLSDSPTRPSYEESQSSTAASSPYTSSPNQAAQDAPSTVTIGSMPAKSHFNPPSITLEPCTSTEDSTALHNFHEEVSGTADGIPRSVPEITPQYPEQTTQSTSSSMVKNWMSQRSWLQNTMGSTMLAATLIGLFIYQRRSYRISIWAAENDFMQSCIGLAQINHTLSERCNKVIEEGVGEAPYTKRGLHSPGVGTYKLAKRIFDVMERGGGLRWNASSIENFASTSTSGVSTAKFTLFSDFWERPIPLAAWNKNSQGTWTLIHYSLLFTAALFLVLQGFLLFRLLSPSRTEPVITSQAHTEVKVTRHYSEGAETTSSEGPLRFTKDFPGDNHPFGQIRRRFIQDRAQEERPDSVDREGGLSHLDSKNSSANTLVGSWTGLEISKVSITTSHDDKHHEGLLELKSTDSTKHFFDPKTGEFIHLTPWKSTPDGGDNRSTSKVKPKNCDVSHVVAKLGAGSAAFTSKQVDQNTLAKEKKKRTRRIKEIKEDGERKLAREIKEIKEKRDARGKTPPRAGDCVTGDMTNEAPSAQPTMI